jgi:hypothetical protein
MPRPARVVDGPTMGLDFPVTVVCDKCGAQTTTIRVAITKLKPQAEMHVRLPDGWAASSLPESGELLITCPSCPPTLVTVPPVATTPDPAMDPTVPPPPDTSSE